jgi:hypothetical protein
MDGEPCPEFEAERIDADHQFDEFEAGDGQDYAARERESKGCQNESDNTLDFLPFLFL